MLTDGQRPDYNHGSQRSKNAIEDYLSECADDCVQTRKAFDPSAGR